MKSNRSTYRHINSSLKQLYPKSLTGRQAQHIDVLTAIMTGLVISQSSHLEKIARKMPSDNQIESRIKSCTRFNQNENIAIETHYMPFLLPLIMSLAETGLIVLAMDGSKTGRKCVTLMVSIIYEKRSIPIAWLTVKGSKGHLPEDVHLELFRKIQGVFPPNCDIIFLGDGEFDSIGLQKAVIEAGWSYVCRTAKNCIIVDGDDVFSLSEVCIDTSEEVLGIQNVGFTHDAYPVVQVIIWWAKGYKDPIYLVTNMECAEEACHYYKYRFRIETFFSDQKSRGFNLQQSHISDPDRIARFLIVTCLAYVWIIYLGVQVRDKVPVLKMIHRADRCDLSLFQLGIRYFEYLLNRGELQPFHLNWSV